MILFTDTWKIFFLCSRMSCRDFLIFVTRFKQICLRKMVGAIFCISACCDGFLPGIFFYFPIVLLRRWVCNRLLQRDPSRCVVFQWTRLEKLRRPYVALQISMIGCSSHWLHLVKTGKQFSGVVSKHWTISVYIWQVISPRSGLHKPGKISFWMHYLLMSASLHIVIQRGATFCLTCLRPLLLAQNIAVAFFGFSYFTEKILFSY